MDDLDHILLEQYHSTKRRLKTIKRLRAVFNYQEDLDMVEHQTHRELKFYESMIRDKSLLGKKPQTR